MHTLSKLLFLTSLNYANARILRFKGKHGNLKNVIDSFEC